MSKILLITILLLSLPFLFPRTIFAQELYIDENGRTYIEWQGTVLGESSVTSPDAESRSGPSGSTSTNTGSTSSGKEGDDQDNDEGENSEKSSFRDSVEDERSLKRLEIEDDRIRVKIKPLDEADDEDEFEDEDESTRSGQSVKEIRVREHGRKRELRIRTRGEKVELEIEGVRARTNFPISIGPNNELIITTPAGSKVVTVLPDAAVKNLLEKGFPVASPSGVQPGDGSPSATLTGLSQDVVLVEEDGALVYKAKVKKSSRLLGLVTIEGEYEAKVSAETGQIIQYKEPWYFAAFGFLFR